MFAGSVSCVVQDNNGLLVPSWTCANCYSWKQPRLAAKECARCMSPVLVNVLFNCFDCKKAWHAACAIDDSDSCGVSCVWGIVDDKKGCHQIV